MESDLVLELADLLSQPCVPNLVVIGSLRHRLDLLVSSLKIRQGHSDLQLLIEELELGHGIGLPLIEPVDLHLDRCVLLSKVAVLGMILASEHLLLVLQVGVLARQSKQVKVKD